MRYHTWICFAFSFKRENILRKLIPRLSLPDCKGSFQKCSFCESPTQEFSREFPVEAGMMERRHEGAEYPAHITFSKFKYKLQNLITEVRQLREKDQNTRRDLEILVQKQRNDEAEQHKKCAALHAEIAAADKVQSNLENKVKDLQNEISIMANKQKESKGVIDSLLQSKEKLTNDLKASNYELKRDIDTKESMLAILKGKLSRNLALLEAVEREVVCVKLAIDETCQMLRGKEDEVFGLKQKLDKIMEYEKLFIEKIHLLEKQMEEKQIELSKKDTVIADLKDRLEYMIHDRKLQLQIEELQKLVEVKEEAIQNLVLDKEALLSEVQSLELVLSKFQDLQMETSPKRLLESQVEYTLQEQIPRAEETLTQQNQEECMRAEKENYESESERSELLAQIHDLTENNIQYCDRGSSPYVKQEGDNLNQYQRDSSSTNEMQMRRSEKVYLGTRKGKSQCGQTCTLSKESVEPPASKNAPILQASQVNVQSSPITEVTYGQIVRNHRNIEKSISCQDKASNIHSIFLKLDRSGFLAASEKTDLYPYALDHCASSHSLSSSSLSTNGPASALIGEVSSKTYVKEEREQLLDSSNQTATNITEENKKVIDAEYHNASENVRSEDNVMNGSKNVMDSSVDQDIFEYAKNGANVTDENNTIMDSACWSPFQKVTYETSIMERREQALDLANHIASLDAKNETNVIEENQQAVDSVDQNGSNMEILTEENKEIRDSVDQIGVHNVTNHSNLTEENEQALDSVSLTAFCNESKHPRFMKHGIFPDNIQERVATSFVCTHSTSLPGEVKIQCPTKMDNSFTTEKEFNRNFNDTETNIIESLGYVHEDCDDNLPASKVKCVKCEQRFSDTHFNLERKGLDEVALTNFSYTCQNCKNEHGKKRRKLGFLTPELAPKRYG